MEHLSFCFIIIIIIFIIAIIIIIIILPSFSPVVILVRLFFSLFFVQKF